MNFMLTIVLLVNATATFILCRPADSPEFDERIMEESEYDLDSNAEVNDADEADDANTNVENDLPAKVVVGENSEETESGIPDHRVIDFSGNTYLQRVAEERSARDNGYDNMSGKQQYGNRDILDEKIDDSMDASKVVPQSLTKRGMLNTRMNKIPGMKEDRTMNRDETKYSQNSLRHEYTMQNVDKKIIEDQSNAKSLDTSYGNESDMLFTDNNHNINLSDELKGTSGEIKNVRNRLKNEEINYNRDRRNIQEKSDATAEAKSSTLLYEEDNIKSEDEEATIKKHVKRLSEEELDDLLKSLSDSKKELLRKIIDSDNNKAADSLNKRDITKKAGAVEETNLNDNNQLESGKIQSEASGDITTDTTITDISSDKKDSCKQEDTLGTDPTSAKNLDTTTVANTLGSKVPVTSITDTVTESDKGNAQAKRKRDAFEMGKQHSHESFSGVADMDTNLIQKKDKDYFCPQGQEYSNLIDYESQLHKREVPLNSNDQISDSFKSLEESFPNSNSYDDSAANMVPLIRVKRKNVGTMVKKRAAALVPDAKVSYFPYRAENDDEDNDEGNEFDDDGFYDRTSNLAKNVAEKHGIDKEFNFNADKLTNNNQDLKPETINNPYNSMKEHSSDNNMIGLGSDTDNILSNVEGVDDNLMFSSGSRSRRSSKYDLETAVPTVSSLEKNEDKHLQSLDNRMSYPIYQENDAFGPLQPNCEEGLGRYKRIRNANNEPSDLENSP